LTPSEQLRQLGDVCGDAPGLVARQQVRRKLDADAQARLEEQELRRQRYQAILDAWVEGQRAAAAEEGRIRRELDPFNFGHWN
jgi:hypothetical protein